MADMFFASLVLTVLCHKAVSLEASSNVSEQTEVERWNKQVAMDADKDGLDKFLYSIYMETTPLFHHFETTSPGIGNSKIQCGEILKNNPDFHEPRVILDIRSLGLIKWKTTVGIEIPGEPLQCKTIVGLRPLYDFLKSIEKAKYKDLDLYWLLYGILEKWEDYVGPKLQSVYGTRSASPIEDNAKCNLCLTDREWIFIGIGCVVLALCINNILLPRLKRERIKVHYPVSNTLKLPH